jgi:type VI secretion system protein ImpB
VPDNPILLTVPAASSQRPIVLAPSSREQVRVGYLATPKLDRLMELRDALVVLKGPLANDAALRENVQKLLFNDEADDRVLGKVASLLLPPARLIPVG